MKASSVPFLVLIVFSLSATVLFAGQATACQPAPKQITIHSKSKKRYSILKYDKNKPYVNSHKFPKVKPYSSITPTYHHHNPCKLKPNNRPKVPYIWEAPTKEDKRIEADIEKTQKDYGVASKEAGNLMITYAKKYYHQKQYLKAKSMLEKLTRINRMYHGIKGLHISDMFRLQAKVYQAMAKNPNKYQVAPVMCRTPSPVSNKIEISNRTNKKSTVMYYTSKPSSNYLKALKQVHPDSSIKVTPLTNFKKRSSALKGLNSKSMLISKSLLPKTSTNTYSPKNQNNSFTQK